MGREESREKLNELPKDTLIEMVITRTLTLKKKGGEVAKARRHVEYLEIIIDELGFPVPTFVDLDDQS